MFQDYLDNLPVFLPRFAPIFYQICSDFGADLVLSDNTAKLYRKVLILIVMEVWLSLTGTGTELGENQT